MTQAVARKNDKVLHEKKLFVQGFPTEGTTEEAIFNLFAQHGDVDRVLMGYKSEGQIAFRGFAYIVMEDIKSCTELLKIGKLNFKGHTILIEKCRVQEKVVPSPVQGNSSNSQILSGPYSFGSGSGSSNSFGPYIPQRRNTLNGNQGNVHRINIYQSGSQKRNQAFNSLAVNHPYFNWVL